MNAPAVRLCPACRKPLIRWPGEYLSHFTQRKCCDVKCCRSMRHGGMPVGYTMPRKEVACTGGCGKKLSRAHHYATAVCQSCRKRRHQENQAGSYDKRREEARRYRILMALSPYGSWEELLRAIRMRQPRTHAVSYDLAVEKRRRSA